MPTHARTYLVLLALQGNASRIGAVLQAATAADLSVLIITDRRFANRVQESLAELDSGLPAVVATTPAVTLTTLRGGARRVLVGSARRLGTFLYRVTRFLRHRMRLPGAIESILETSGERARNLPSSVRLVYDRWLDPPIGGLATFITASRQTIATTRQFHELLRVHRVLAVICLDAPSLLPSWRIARRYRGLPVLTDFPVEWNADTVKRFEDIVTGTQW